MANAVDVTRLRRFVMENMPKDSKLRELISSEKDSMPVEDFLSKSEIWFKLLSMEYSK